MPPTIKNQQEALGVLLRALDVAQSKGAFTINESAFIASARSFFIKDDTNTLETIEEEITSKNTSPKKTNSKKTLKN